MKIAIAPTAVFGGIADTAEVVGFSGLPPSYTLNLQRSTTTPAVPAVPEVPAVGEFGDEDYVPAVPAVPEVPARTTYETLHTVTKDAYVRDAQFDAWGTQPLESVLPGWIAANHGLTLA